MTPRSTFATLALTLSLLGALVAPTAATAGVQQTSRGMSWRASGPRPIFVGRPGTGATMRGSSLLRRPAHIAGTSFATAGRVALRGGGVMNVGEMQTTHLEGGATLHTQVRYTQAAPPEAASGRALESSHRSVRPDGSVLTIHREQLPNGDRLEQREVYHDGLDRSRFVGTGRSVSRYRDGVVEVERTRQGPTHAVATRDARASARVNAARYGLRGQRVEHGPNRGALRFAQHGLSVDEPGTVLTERALHPAETDFARHVATTPGSTR